MVSCSKCGADNTSDSVFCKNCGTPIGTAQAPAQPEAPPPPKDFRQEMTEVGKRIGERAGRMGEQVGKDAERAGKDFGIWWDKTLGIFAPVIGGLFGIVAIFFALFVAGVIEASSDHPGFWRDLIDFIEDNFWLLIGLVFLGSFHGYFYRRYHSTFKWVNPIVAGVGFVAWAWVFGQLLMIAGRNSDHPRLGDVGEFIEDMLILVFILAVVVGYLIVWFGLVSPANWDKPERRP